MNHLRLEGTDEHDINTDLKHDISILFQLKIKISLNFRGAESSLCSYAFRLFLICMQVIYYKCNKCTVLLITEEATGLL